MGNNFKNFSNAALAENRYCSVSYTLNNMQPVLCTYIGDQPLHYMDEIEAKDDGEFLDALEFGFLADDIEILREEIAGFDSLPSPDRNQTKKNMTAFCDNAQSLTNNHSLTQKQSDQRLEEIQSILVQSRLAAAYLAVAKKHKIKIQMSRQIEKSFYDRSSGLILLHPDINLSDQILLMSKELRRHWQHRQGILIDPLMFQPDNAILVNRVQEADLTVSVIRIAWELQLAGLRDVWERVETSSMADLARTFAREALIDFRTINNGAASIAVFEAWFLSERCRRQDKQIIQAMMSDDKGYVFGHENTSKQITTELIATLGDMPFGKNYLAPYAQIIMSDPIFIELRERSNANFLWFIKFEHALKEMEHSLQRESDLSTHDIRHDLLKQKSQDQHYECQDSADVIEFLEYRAENKQSDNTSPCFSRKKHSANIINLACWSNEK